LPREDGSVTKSVEREPASGKAAAAQVAAARRIFWLRQGSGALIGLLTAGVALGIGELVAAFVRPAAAPVIAVGNRFILLTPESVKRWATRTFGTSDKNVLVGGIYIAVALFAILIGVLALRRLLYGLIGVTVFGVVGVYSALTANASQTNDVTPTILGTLAALAVLAALVRAAGTDAAVAPPRPRLFANRRAFLQGSVATAGLAVIGGFGGRAAQHARFDVASERAAVTLPAPAVPAPALPAGYDLGKSGVPWVTPNGEFYRIDTALSVPEISSKSWSMRIHGMVEHELTIDYAQLTAMPLIERWITMCCVSDEVGDNLIGNAKFLGVRLADVLRQAGVQSGADQLLMSSSDGMTIGAPTAVVMDGRDALIAVGMNGAPLPIEHGYPVRIVVPGLYGYVSACKWVVDIEVTTFASEQAYWVQGGWLPHPSITVESRIDTPKSGKTVAVGQAVAIAGVAWDQHVGVSKVEVQIGNGAWLQARLATVPSTDTWRQWVLPWTPPKAGSYTVKVRATDAAGVPQTSVAAPPFPGAATGLHTITVRAQ
jgi:DMSO/TMAO reductase YedYZ molybdopterin-dependent catalytic subunit